ncbi:inactive serine/threonine-protein kinase 19 [Patagioenas fasciata]|uniref:inactive serine/threonine-protein kinase 19 n=1 Tax=Patagioenas fasciata TaxID=372321 RepID=UPI003A9A51E3
MATTPTFGNHAPGGRSQPETAEKRRSGGSVRPPPPPPIGTKWFVPLQTPPASPQATPPPGRSDVIAARRPMKRRRRRLEEPRGEPDGGVRGALRSLFSLFPGGLFGDSLPPLVLRHQLYDLVPDRTAVDRHLNDLRAEGRILLLPLGLGPDTLGVVPTESYKEKVLAGVSGTPREGLVRRFLDVAVGREMGFEETRLREMGFGDGDVTQLVGVGLLTVRDAGSWWLALPGVGRFVRELIRGRRALLGVVRRSRHREVPVLGLRERPNPPGARLGVPYLLHDLVGAQLLQSIPTPSGPMLRLAKT